MSKVGLAWQKYFSTVDVVGTVAARGFLDVKATDLKTVTQFEPRILAKWDTSDQWPEIFKKNELGLLPISNQAYRIAPFKVFQNVQTLPDKPIHYAKIPEWIVTLTREQVERSEPLQIAACHAAAVFSDFLDDETKTVEAFTGRLRTGSFSFSVESLQKNSGNLVVPVNNAQIEIDDSFESAHSIVVIEAKNRQVSDFNVRQLYYPWRYISELTHGQKQVIPVFMMCANGVITLLRYQFADPTNFNSLELVSAKRYTFENFRITREWLAGLIASGRPLRTHETFGPRVLFPQANRFEIVLSLCEQLQTMDVSAQSLADDLEYDVRQGDYYLGAAIFLGYVRREAGSLMGKLTPRGVSVFGAPCKVRLRMIVEDLLSIRVFNRTFAEWFVTNRWPSAKQVGLWIAQDGWSDEIGSSTLPRRGSTVIGWCRWIVGLIE